MCEGTDEGVKRIYAVIQFINNIFLATGCISLDADETKVQYIPCREAMYTVQSA